MFFEGSEKKVEIQVKEGFSLLNDIEDSFWSSMVARCNAQILSKITNQHCKAFLLSESSLFVWENRLLILTCGVTKLINSLEFFLKEISNDEIEHIFYQRKNEYFAQAQLSCFGDDIKLLSNLVAGKAYRFGELDSHHNYIFHTDNNFKACAKDKTYELLAYQISDEASAKLTTPGLTKEDIRSYLQLERMLPGFEFDDFVFEPYGYSVNAISENKYLTIHVTPQAGSSYVSIESSENLIENAGILLDILKPASFDLLAFNEFDFEKRIDDNIPTDYITHSRVKEDLSNGYLVHFANFIKPTTKYTSAKTINIAGENHAL